MFLVGLTGGVGTGKSTTASMFRELGVPIVDCDMIAKRIVEPGRPAWQKIKNEFGGEVILEDGSGQLDRDALRRIILADDNKRRSLDRITHPYILWQMAWEVVSLAASGNNFAVLDIPLLFESGGHFINYLHKIAVVVCEPDLQIQRLMENRGLSEAESTALINVQMSLDKKSEKADFVLENSGNLQDLKQQVLEVHQKLNQSTLHWKIRLGIGIALGGLVGMFYLVAKHCGNILNTGGKAQVLAANTKNIIPEKKPYIFNLILG